MTAVLSPPLAPSAPAPPRLDRYAAVDRVVRLCAALLLWAGLLLVTYWWEAGGGITGLAGWTSGLTSVGRLTGLWSADLLLVQALLMARLPPLEHAFGRDRLARIHRVVGFLSFDLMLAHIVTIILGYSDVRWGQVPATTWGMITTYGGVLLALAGTACLVMVVLTSVKRARRRLRYESWHLLHLYAYLGMGLALPHQLWTARSSSARAGRPSTGGACGSRQRVRSSSGESDCRWHEACGTGCESPPSSRSPPTSCRCT